MAYLVYSCGNNTIKSVSMQTIESMFAIQINDSRIVIHGTVVKPFVRYLGRPRGSGLRASAQNYSLSLIFFKQSV